MKSTGQCRSLIGSFVFIEELYLFNPVSPWELDSICEKISGAVRFLRFVL